MPFITLPPFVGDICPIPTDDFESYSVAAFPQAGWSQGHTTGPGTANILASSTPFPTQQLELGAASGALVIESQTRDAPSFQNGEVLVKVASSNPSTGNVQSAVMAQFVDVNNYLELRLRLDTASGLNAICNEIIGGSTFLRGSFTAPGGYAANTVYAIHLIVNGTNARCRILDSECKLLGTPGVDNDFTYTITGGNTGVTGLKRISASATAPIYFDDFYSV